MRLDQITAGVAFKLGKDLGMAYVCRTCEKWRAGLGHAKSVTVRTARCTGHHCFGPPFGAMFQEYEGPLSRRSGGVCFACGERADYVIVGPDNAQVGYFLELGVCSKHVGLLSRNMEALRASGLRVVATNSVGRKNEDKDDDRQSEVAGA